MPAENIDKLQYYGDQEFLLKIFHKDVKETYCCYITTLKHAPKIDNIFSSLYFKQIQIPNFVHGTASEALSMLKEKKQTHLLTEVEIPLSKVLGKVKVYHLECLPDIAAAELSFITVFDDEVTGR